MSSISFLGSYSGIDQSMIDQLMEVEKAPLTQMSDQKSEYETEKYAWKDINTRLDNLMTTLKELKFSTTFLSKTAASSNSSVVTGSADNSALNGTYQIGVTRLATATRVIGSDVLAVGETHDTELGVTGSFTLMNDDGDSALIDITATDSLSSIAIMINDEKDTTGIEATVIDGRLVLQDTETGSRTISLSDTDGLTLDALGIGAAKTETNGQTAQFTVNGISIERDSNTVTDAVEGLTITLKGETSVGEYETLTVGADTATTVSKFESFVNQYNSTLEFMQDANDVGDLEAEVTGAGALAGDPTLQRMISNLRTYVSSQLTGLDSTIGGLSDLGITTTDKTGQLTFDSTKLTAALEDDAENVKNFFYALDGSGDPVGFEVNLETYLNSLIAANTGILDVKQDGLASSIKSLEKSIEKFNDRMELREQYYITMFTRLDVALQEAESQMSWLTSQLSSLSGLSTDSSD